MGETRRLRPCGRPGQLRHREEDRVPGLPVWNTLGHSSGDSVRSSPDWLLLCGRPCPEVRPVKTSLFYIYLFPIKETKTELDIVLFRRYTGATALALNNIDDIETY